MTIPFPFGKRRRDEAPPVQPSHASNPTPTGPAMTENLVASKLAEIKSRAEQAAVDSIDTLPDALRMEQIRMSAEAEIKAMWRPPFDPAGNADDRIIQERLDSLREDEKRLVNVLVQEKAIREKAMEAVPAAPVARPQPSIPVVICGVLGFAVEVGASLYPAVAQMVEDGPTVVMVSGLIGIVFGTAIVYGAMGVGGEE